ncbi:uroporphyrinogen decarboxylase family protein [Thermodesulfobacteriota bacterium]
MINAKMRIIAMTHNQKPDHMPCFGANSTVTYDQMKAVNAFWPGGHEKGEIMARQAMAAHTLLGFDAVRAPFCKTMEAEALGCRIKSGGRGGSRGCLRQSVLSKRNWVMRWP